MTKPYSMDLRERAISRLLAGERARSVARMLALSPSSVIKWAQRHKRLGSVAPGKMGGHRPLLLGAEHAEWLRQRVANDPDVTTKGLAGELAARGVIVGYVTIWRFLKREGKSYKKNRVPKRATSA